MKKKQFNEYVARKQATEQRNITRKHMRTVRKAGHFSLDNVVHMRRGLERHALLLSAGVAIFEYLPFPDIDTLFGKENMSFDQRQVAASKRTIDFVRNPYKFNRCTRGNKINRAEHKLLVQKVMHYAKVESITITRRQITQIINRYCPYKTVSNAPSDPFVARLRTERHHMQWVIRLARICLTYVQLGSDFPMWTYYKSGRSFTYGGIDKLAQTVSYSSGVDALARNVKEMAALYKPNLVRGGLGEGPNNAPKPGEVLIAGPIHGQSMVKSGIGLQALMKRSVDDARKDEP